MLLVTEWQSEFLSQIEKELRDAGKKVSGFLETILYEFQEMIQEATFGEDKNGKNKELSETAILRQKIKKLASNTLEDFYNILTSLKKTLFTSSVPEIQGELRLQSLKAKFQKLYSFVEHYRNWKHTKKMYLGYAIAWSPVALKPSFVLVRPGVVSVNRKVLSNISGLVFTSATLAVPLNKNTAEPEKITFSKKRELFQGFWKGLGLENAEIFCEIFRGFDKSGGVIYFYEKPAYSELRTLVKEEKGMVKAIEVQKKHLEVFWNEFVSLVRRVVKENKKMLV